MERHFAAQEMAADRTLVKLFLEAVKVLKKGHVLCFGSEGSLAGIDERLLGNLKLLVQSLSHT